MLNKLYKGLFAFFLFTLANQAIAAIPASEREALIALYHSTGGANWKNNGGWLGAQGTECEWSGVKCTGNNVTELDLNNNQLTGTIPVELGQLTQLGWLKLGSNQLTGTIPAELGQLTQLRLFDLFKNQLTGPIPAELGQLTQLTHLLLHNNQLTGSIPVELGQLIELGVLYLYNNQLTGSIPAELGQLTQLTKLGLEDNCLNTTDPDLINFLDAIDETAWRNQRTDCSLPILIKGHIAGLTGQGLVLQNSGANSLSINANGEFIFSSALIEGDTYAVSVFKQPTKRNQICSVINGEGTIFDTNITDVEVNCVDTTYIGGDVGGDGSVDIADVVAGITIVLSSGAISNGSDCNNDGDMNILDIVCTINRVLGN